MAVVTTQQSVAALYTAIFNRAPDQAGLNFWTAQINGGASFATIAEGFAQHEVFTTGIGALPNADYVNALYTNILGSAGDAAGVAYWTARLAAGESKASVVASFVEGSLTIDLPALLAAGSLTQADYDLALVRQQTLTNKADVGIYFANTLGAASNLNPATVSTSKAGLEADPIYKASQAAIAGVDSTAASVTTAQDAIAVAAGSPNPAQALLGQTFTLTTGADTFVGGASGDVFNALSVKADGAPATTLSAFDSIDGGAGKDTLNIYTTGAENLGLNGATVKNVETINVYNTAAAGAFGDASKFVGATAINQIGNSATNVTNLAATTKAGFNGTLAAPISVQAAAAAATATVALTNVAEAATLVLSAAAGGVLNSVIVSGTRVDTTPATPIADLGLTVTAGKDVESVSINTSINSVLTVGNEATSTKSLSSVDASASTGNIDLDTVALGATIASVKTGTGADKVGLATSLNATVIAASVSTGAGNDTINVEAVVGTAATGQTVTIDAGEGNDAIKLDVVAGIGYNVQGGAGDDTVTVASGTIKTTDKIDGGAGTDTVSVAGQATARIADDFIVFNKVLTNFETLKFSSAEGVLDSDLIAPGLQTVAFDASQLAANYTSLDFAAGSVVDNVGTQALVANGALTAEAVGYTAAAGAVATVYAGSLNITEKLSGTVLAHADTVNLTVKGSADTLVANNAVLTGEAKSATVTLSAGTNTQGTTVTTDDVLVASKVTITNTTAAEGLKDLASLTLSGNGVAEITNADGTKLVSVDASGLNSVDVAGKAVAGLTYTSTNTLAETIKLGAGVDTVTLNASTYGKVDVLTGLNLVLNAAGTALDAQSDKLSIANVSLVAGSKGFTTTQTDLQLALKDAATYSALNGGVDLAFHQGGNTYVFSDSATSQGLIDATDTVVQLTGQVNLDALILAA